MARPPASEARDTRRELLDAALELFAERGFHGTSLRDLGRAVGVRESAIYHHFENKEALLREVLEEPYRSPSLPLRKLPEMDLSDLPAAMEKLALALIERFSTLREMKRFKLMLGDGLRLAAEGRFNFLEQSGHPREVLGAVFARLMEEGRLRRADPEFLAMAFLAPILLWRQLQVVLPGHRFIVDPKPFARLHAEQFLAGAGAAVASTGPPRK